MLAIVDDKKTGYAEDLLAGVRALLAASIGRRKGKST